MALVDDLNISKALEQLSRLPAAVRYAVLVAVVACVVLIYGVTVYKGVNRELSGLETRLTQIQAKIAEGRAVASNLTSFEEKQEELRGELELALERLPDQRELPVLLTDINSLGKKAGLEIRSFRPAPEVNRGFYAEVPIDLEFLGRYHEAGTFFDRLSRLSRIINITELEMVLVDVNAATPRLRVKGVATTFRFVEESGKPGGGT